jgi:hypothetical protein
MTSTKITIQSFYKEFYGHNFLRHFRAPTNLKIRKKRHSGNQHIIKNPKILWLQVYKWSGLCPCYIHIYNHGLIGNLKRQNCSGMVYDRAFFDFDIKHHHSHKLKKELQHLRRHGLKYKQEQQNELKEQLRNLIIKDHIAELAINEAKDFAIRFKESFGSYPILFFSGGKGCHAYTFFSPLKNVDINRALSSFGENLLKAYKYKTLDLSVLKDAKSRLSRIPYSKHQYTLLNVVPFSIHDSYEDIISKSLNPVVELFQKENYLSSFGSHLETIDPILKQNEDLKKINKKANMAKPLKFNSFSGVNDHRAYFKKLLGSPKSEHPDKEYVMYCCPFPKHEDNNPSFKVHKTGYECYGCGKNGNLARKKDYLEFKEWMDEIK